MRNRALDILVVEDNPGDARLIAEAFKEIRAKHRLIHVLDGEQALAYLSASTRKETPRPALVLLDLNLPRCDGREVLQKMKSDVRLKAIPVVVFTTSEAPEDIQRVYDLAANCYVTKPGDLDRFLEVVRVIQEFWLNIVQLPM